MRENKLREKYITVQTKEDSKHKKTRKKEILICFKHMNEL